jgi:GDP-4-dehydro-6-deoxy-D-mannose reductase
MRSLVTGALGSGGSYMAEYLLSIGDEVHGLARWHTSPYWKDKPPFAVHECDLTDAMSVYRAMERVRPDVIYHLASHANVRASFDNPRSVLLNNIECTLSLLEAVRDLRTRFQTWDPIFLMCSSSEVYGQVKPDAPWVYEDSALAPVSPYAISKLAQDMLGLSYFKSYGIKVIRTRMFTYINPRRSDLFATSFAMQVARIEAGLQAELVHGNLESVRTILDVRDAVRAYHLAAAKGIPGEVYNIGGSKTCTVGDVLNELVRQAKAPIPVRQDPALLRPADVTLQIPDCHRFKRRTGWEPEISVQDSIAHLLDHCRSVVGTEARARAA